MVGRQVVVVHRLGYGIEVEYVAGKMVVVVGGEGGDGGQGEGGFVAVA